MTEQLQQLKGGAGRKKAQQNLAFATTAVLHLSDTFISSTLTHPVALT